MDVRTRSVPSLERTRRYLTSCVRIDTRTLAVFRVVVGLLIVADVLLRSRNFHFFYTDEGAVPRELAMAWTPDQAFSVYYYVSDPTVVAALFVVQILVAIQLIVGFKTRTATIVSFLLVVSLDHRNPFVISYADIIFRLLLFWAIFLPLGARWSVDAVHRDVEPRRSIASVASAAILLQMVSMYVVNGYHKTHYEGWLTGDATPLVFGMEHLTFVLGDFMREFPTLLYYGGLLWFYMLLLAWALILLRGRARMAFVAMFMAGHASFALTVRIGAFPYVTIAGLLLFLQAQFWEDLHDVARFAGVDVSSLRRRLTSIEEFARAVPNVQIAPEFQAKVNGFVYDFALAAVAISVGLMVAVSLLQAGGVVADEAQYTGEIEYVAEGLGVDQPEWGIFVPPPDPMTYYYVFPAETADGERIDAYNDRALSYDRPYDELQKQFGTYRERFYMSTVSQTSNDLVPLREELADHVCEEWEENHDTELTHVNMYQIIEEYSLETIDDLEDREVHTRQFYRHGCGDNEPKDVAPPESFA